MAPSRARIALVMTRTPRKTPNTRRSASRRRTTKKVDLVSLFRGYSDEMATALRTTMTAVRHPTLKGDAAERRWVSWLKDYLPERYCVHQSACLIDSRGMTD